MLAIDINRFFYLLKWSLFSTCLLFFVSRVVTDIKSPQGKIISVVRRVAQLGRDFTLDYNNMTCCHRPRQVYWYTAWSTLIGRGMSRLGSHWSRVMLSPALLCHKEPARRIQSVFCLLLAGSLWPSRPMRAEPRHSSTNESGPHCW